MSRLLTCLGLLALFASPSPACSVPVFRWALERWKASPYVVTVYHKAPLTEAQTRHAESLERPEANVAVEFSEETKGPAAGKPLPWAVVRGPRDTKGAGPIWSGPLEKLEAEALCYSPARQELARKLTSGASAVWLLLESGDGKADDAADKLLRAELAQLEKDIELPPADETAPDLKSPVPLKVSFSVLRLRRDAPGEAMFVRQLLAVEEGLAEVKGPIVFPIYGRARALCALHGKELTRDWVADSAGFLCRKCSCTVKRLNPGADLLVSADWAGLIKLGEVPDEPEGPASSKGAEKPTVKPAAIPPGVKKPAPSATSEERPAPTSSGWGLVPWAIGAVVILALVAGVFALRGTEPNEQGTS